MSFYIKIMYLVSIVLHGRGTLDSQGAQEKNVFPVTFKFFATMYKSLSVWAEALKI